MNVCNIYLIYIQYIPNRAYINNDDVYYVCCRCHGRAISVSVNRKPYKLLLCSKDLLLYMRSTSLLRLLATGLALQKASLNSPRSKQALHSDLMQIS